jgi:hypothetical protein
MGFLKRIFGSVFSSPASQSRDSDGFFLYVKCSRCGKNLRLRINKQYDLNRTDAGYVWNKTIVDNRCFRPMETEVHFDRSYRPVRMEIEGGEFISETEYESPGASEITDSTGPGG